MANTLAYYNTATITAVKSFIVQAPEVVFSISSVVYTMKHYFYLVKLSNNQIVSNNPIVSAKAISLNSS